MSPPQSRPTGAAPLRRLIFKVELDRLRAGFPLPLTSLLDQLEPLLCNLFVVNQSATIHLSVRFDVRK